MELSSYTQIEIRKAIAEATRQLQDEHVAVPRLTAEVLLAHALGHRKEWLYAHGNEKLPEKVAIRFAACVNERLAGKPTQYITGVQEFYGLEFHVTPAVLIPRPETEHLVEVARARVEPGVPLRILDVGTGSGAIAVTLALEPLPPGSRVFAVDLSEAALQVARDNAHRLNATVDFARSDLLTCIASQSIDIVVSNPPYIPEKERETLQREVRDHEPELALYSGPDGMFHYRQLAEQARRVLRPGGWLAMELAFDAASRVQELLLEHHWDDVSVQDDLAGYPRVIAARLSRP